MEKQNVNSPVTNISIKVEKGGINNINYGPVTFYGTAQQPSEPSAEPLVWNDRQLTILQKAVDKGLLDHLDDGYKWNMGTALLDYFLGRLLMNDQPQMKGELLLWTATTDADLPRTELNPIFHRKDIGNYRSKQISKNAQAPRGHEKVDELF